MPIRERIEALLEAERDQLPFWLPVGLCAGVAGWYALPTPAAWAGLLLGAAGIALIGLAFVRGSRAGRAIGLFALAIMLGCGLTWLRAERMAGSRLERAQIATFSAGIERVEPLPARESTRLLLLPIAQPDCPYACG